MARKKRTTGLTFECTRCGIVSPPAEGSSPAARELTALEALERDHGWSFEVDFAAMLTGDYRARCPGCTAVREAVRTGVPMVDPNDQQPWRCAECDEPVRPGMNDPCACTRIADEANARLDAGA